MREFGVLDSWRLFPSWYLCLKYKLDIWKTVWNDFTSL